MGEVITIEKQADGNYLIKVPAKGAVEATTLNLTKEEMGELIEAIDNLAE